jgi:hypothetical protein
MTGIVATNAVRAELVEALSFSWAEEEKGSPSTGSGRTVRGEDSVQGAWA